VSTGKKRIRRPKHTREFIKSQFKKFGYKLLTKTYKNSKQILEVRCKNGHRWCVNWNNFSRGTRCRRCFIQAQIKDNKTLKKVVLRDKFFCVSEVSRMLGLNDNSFRYYVSIGRLPGPKHEFPGSTKKHYKIEDIEKIQRMIEIDDKV
jgi:hypothetical protein